MLLTVISCFIQQEAASVTKDFRFIHIAIKPLKPKTKTGLSLHFFTLELTKYSFIFHPAEGNLIKARYSLKWLAIKHNTCTVLLNALSLTETEAC